MSERATERDERTLDPRCYADGQLADLVLRAKEHADGLTRQERLNLNEAARRLRAASTDAPPEEPEHLLARDVFETLLMDLHQAEPRSYPEAEEELLAHDAALRRLRQPEPAREGEPDPLEKNPPWALGWIDRATGRGIGSDPFKYGGRQSQEWRKGWTDADQTLNAEGRLPYKCPDPPTSFPRRRSDATAHHEGGSDRAGGREAPRGPTSSPREA